MSRMNDGLRHYARRGRSFWARHTAKGKARFFFMVLGWAVLASGALLSVFFFSITRSLPSPEQIANPPVAESTKIYDRTGTVLLYELSSGQKRTYVDFDQIPQNLKDATLAIEDTNFYNEPAFDWHGILRSLWYDVTNPGSNLRGGSTITQQLARNAFLTLDQTFTRKIKELIVAIEINRQYTKDKVLELYLNAIPYGPVIYGVENASQAYFGKPASDLTLAQAAVLAAIPKAPSYYSPWGNNTKQLMVRQRLVLQRMYDTGRINKDQLDAALAEKITFMPQSSQGLKAGHFVAAVEDYLSQKYGEDAVRTGGLRVYTTLDWDLQQAAEQTVEENAARNEKLYGGQNGALVAEDPRTGQILAMVGSRDYFDTKNDGQFNVATQGLRQPGSALKPFVYMNGFMKGYTPDTVLFDVATEFGTSSACPTVPTTADFNATTPDSRCFHPQDFEGYFSGPLSVRTALAQSVNVPAVKMLYLVGLRSTVSLLQSVGLTTLNEPDRYGLSLVLGGGAVHLVDLVRAYSVLSQEGTLHDQSMVLKVQDRRGNVLEQYVDHAQQVVDPQYPRMITNILSDVNARAGLFQSSLGLTVFPGYQVAMKTGTSNDYRDAWTIGYTPSLVVGVWAGNNDNAAMHRNGSSILAAVPMWSAFMKKALATQPPEAFTPPDPVQEPKPVLAGQYVVNGEVHDILYYVDKSDPTGPPPTNPASDPQFAHWEAGVQAWAGAHPFQVTPPPPPTGTGGEPGTGGTSSSTPAPTPLFPYYQFQ